MVLDSAGFFQGFKSLNSAVFQTEIVDFFKKPSQMSIGNQDLDTDMD